MSRRRAPVAWSKTPATWYHWAVCTVEVGATRGSVRPAALQPPP